MTAPARIPQFPDLRIPESPAPPGAVPQFPDRRAPASRNSPRLTETPR